MRVAELVRAIIAFPATVVVDATLILRALEVYELDRLDLAEAYLAGVRGEMGRRDHRELRSHPRPDPNRRPNRAGHGSRVTAGH